jgi:hypothetical protein
MCSSVCGVVCGVWMWCALDVRAPLTRICLHIHVHLHYPYTYMHIYTTQVSVVGHNLRVRRRREARRESETASVRRQLALLSRKARRLVARAARAKVTSLEETSRPRGEAAEEGWKGVGGFDAAAKAARILKVKARADKRLDALLAQVNKEIQRKKWRAQEAGQGKQLA